MKYTKDQLLAHMPCPHGLKFARVQLLIENHA